MMKFCRVGPLWLWLLVRCASPRSDIPAEQQPAPQWASVPMLDSTVVLSGEQLSRIYCQSCHLYPEPALLDQKSWQQGVLPNMAMRLGIGLPRQNPYKGMSYSEVHRVTEAGVFPKKALITPGNWEKITQYYLTHAPEKPLPQAPKAPVHPELPGFATVPLSLGHSGPPLTTLVKIDSTSGQLYVGSRRNVLMRLDKGLQKRDSVALDSPPSDVLRGEQGEMLVLTMGIMNPSDEALGRLSVWMPAGGSLVAQWQELPRPVQFARADLNEDGRADVVICGYGNAVGQLAWYENTGEAQPPKEHVLKALSGARRVIIRDCNRDGRPDMVVLMAQAAEGIFVYYNEGEGQFREKALLRFPPVYGSSDFELVDFNRDGAWDILYTNGDNADYSISLKRYHGVRLYLNDGRDHFREAWFYPLHGATRALARDFDQDGDLDIAAIAFFPDAENQPEQGFVYLENRGNSAFEARTFEGSQTGRWLTLDAGDIDRDGDLDLVMGSFMPQAATLSPAIRPDVVILRNEKR